MSKQRFATSKIFLVLMAVWAIGLTPSLISDRYLDTPFGLFLLIPFLSVYLLSGLGLPGLLVNGGACGWGWCPPSVLGWAAAAAIWLIVLYGIAAAISRLIAGRSAPET